METPFWGNVNRKVSPQEQVKKQPEATLESWVLYKKETWNTFSEQ